MTAGAALALALLAAVLVAWARAAAAALGASRATPRSSERSRGRTALLRPLAGDAPGLDGRLAVTGGLERAFFGVATFGDPALDAATRAASSLSARGATARVVITGATTPNRKAGQLAALAHEARAEGDDTLEFFVVADADVTLDDATVDALLAAVATPDVALAWLAPGVAEPATRGDHVTAAVLGGSLHAFPLLAGLDPRGVVGKCFVVRARALAEEGGFGALGDVLGEDWELARRVLARGHRVVRAHGLARLAPRHEPTGVVVARFARWMQVVRGQRPHLLVGYPVFFAPVVPAVALATLTAGPLRAGSLAALALARLALAHVAAGATAPASLPPRGAGRAFGRALVRAVVGDVALLLALARALASRRFAWRGVPLALGADGRLAPGEAATGLPELAPLAQAASEGPGQHRLRQRAEPRHGRRERHLEGLGVRLEQVPADARELGPDGLLVRAPGSVDVTRPGAEGPPEGHERLGPLGAAVHVPQPEGQHGGPRDAGDLGGAAAKGERLGLRALASLREDPDDVPRPAQEARGVPHGAGAVPRLVEVDAEGADGGEERETTEVRRVHQRVPVDAEHPRTEPQHDERVPEGDVVRDDDDGPLGRRAASRAEPVDVHAREATTQARLRVAGEPALEDGQLARRDQGGLR